MNLPSFPFTVLDTETTGFLPGVHKIIEFASIRCEGGKEVDVYEQLFSIETDVPPHVEVLTRIKTADLKDKPTFDASKASMLEHIGSDTLIVGQNIPYDIGMLKGQGIDLTDRPFIDTSMLASIAYPEFHSYSLPYMSAKLSLTHEPAHRALGDVRATLALLSHVWERLQELSPAQLQEAQDIMRRSSSGMRMLFDALQIEKGTGASWLLKAKKKTLSENVVPLSLPAPDAGTVMLQEETLHPSTLQAVLDGAVNDETTTHFIVVKNLTAALRLLDVPTNAHVIYPPSLLLDPPAAEALLAQETFTADESTLALKLRWFAPRVRDDIQVHGGERDVWLGKLACTPESAVYREQFQTKAHTYLIDHQQLLHYLTDNDERTLPDGSHVIIDDASMLEDTATKAFGHYLSLESLRAASQGDELLMRLTDIMHLWIERIRNGEDQHFLTTGDLSGSDVGGVRSLIAEQLARTDLAHNLRTQLMSAQSFFDPTLLQRHIAWSECRQDGSLQLVSAPLLIGKMLKEALYDHHPTTLLIPQGCNGVMPQIIPADTKTILTDGADHLMLRLPISFPADFSMQDFLAAPPPGKSIVLIPSKRLIEQHYVDHAERLEAAGITLICLGLSGGQGRMTAEFQAAEGSVVWLLTPWMYEGIELSPQSVDRLILCQLPFDHPSHPVYSKRSEHYQNAFMDYSFVRLKHRVFRLLRSFCEHRTDAGEALIADKRIHEKKYGRELMQYLEQFDAQEEKPAASPKKRKSNKKDDGMQMQMPV